MIAEERKFCPYCKRPSLNTPCIECRIILKEFESSKHWNYKDLSRYTELLFNKEFYKVANVLIRSHQSGGMTFNQIHHYLASTHTPLRLSRILTSLMYLGYCYQPVPNMYKFKLFSLK